MKQSKTILRLFLLILILTAVACQDVGEPTAAADPDPVEPSPSAMVESAVEEVEPTAAIVPAIPTETLEPILTDEPTAEPAATETKALPEPTATAPIPTMVEVRFFEGAPKDRFQIENTGTCPIADAIVRFDLTQSVGQLIFDTSASGVGVEVFQPFEVVAGEIELVSADAVVDGEALLDLRVARLNPGEPVSFTIDVDDTLENSELGMIQVTDSEIEGGLISVSNGDLPTATGLFEGSMASVEIFCP